MASTPVPPSDRLSGHEQPDQEASQSLSARVRRGALWSVLSALILRLTNIIITAIVAHILAPRDFGVFAVALTAYTIVSSVGQLGVGSCLMRADLDIEAMAPTLVTVSVVTNTILASAMAVFARSIAGALGSVAGTGPVRVMALALFLEGVFAVPWGQLTREFRQDKLFWANAISFVPSTAALLLLAKSGDGAMAFAWSKVITQFVMGCVNVAFLPKIYRPSIARGALSLLFKFGVPLAGANFVNYILLNVDYAFVGHLIGVIALGAYVLAFNVASWPAGLLGSVINTVSMPAFSRVKHDPDLMRNAMGDSLRAVSLIVMPMCGLMMALARPLVLTLYGTKWAASAHVLSILSLYGAISIICVLFANMLTSLGKAKFVLGVQLLWLGALVPAMAIGVHRNGIVGAAVAHIVVIGPLVLPSYLFALRKATGVRFATLGKAILPSLLAASAAAFAARGAASQFARPQAQLVIGLIAGGLVYVVAAAPQGVAFLSQEQTSKLRALHLFRFYDNAARLVRLPVGSRPYKEAADRYQARHAANRTGGGQGTATVPLRLANEGPGADRGQTVTVEGEVAGLPYHPISMADAYDKYAASLYGYCRWMLYDPADAADAMRDTFAIAAFELDSLGDASELRPRLYALARNECYRRLRTPEAGLYLAGYVAGKPDDAERAELRMLVGTILAGLNPAEREVIQLSLRHNLSDTDLAIVLETSWSRAHALVSRARGHLEKSLGMLLIARTGRQACPELDQLLAGWDGRLTRQMLDLIGPHIEQCEACVGRRRGALRPEVLSSLMPLAPLPQRLREQVLGLSADPDHPGQPHALTYRQRLMVRVEQLRHLRLPQTARLVRWRRIRGNPRAALAMMTAAIWIVVAAVSIALFTFAGSHSPHAVDSRASVGTSAAASTPTTVIAGAPVSTRPRSSPLRQDSSQPATSAPAPAAAATLSPTERGDPSPSSSSKPTNSATPSTSSSPSPSRTPSPSRSPSPTRSPSPSPTPSPSPSSSRSP